MDTVTLTDDEARMVESIMAEFGMSRERAIADVLIGTRGRWADDVIDEPTVDTWTSRSPSTTQTPIAPSG